MTASSIGVNVRGALKTAMAGIAANKYDYVPPTVIPPIIVTGVPNDPYLETTLINKSITKVKVNLVITCGVTFGANATSLDQLEKLVLSVLAAIPSNFEVGAITAPVISSVGASDLLTANIPVATYYTQTN